jgi:hypothetical protein
MRRPLRVRRATHAGLQGAHSRATREVAISCTRELTVKNGITLVAGASANGAFGRTGSPDVQTHWRGSAQQQQRTPGTCPAVGSRPRLVFSVRQARASKG